MVGLAFESRDSWLSHKIESKMATSGAKLTEMEEKEPLDIHPGFLDVFHYAFCYVGVLTGNSCVTHVFEFLLIPF